MEYGDGNVVCDGAGNPGDFFSFYGILCYARKTSTFILHKEELPSLFEVISEGILDVTYDKYCS